MAKETKIELTPQELNDIKDEVKFRTMVMISLKRLDPLPDKVNKNGIHIGIHWALISIILVGLIGIAFKSIQ